MNTNVENETQETTSNETQETSEELKIEPRNAETSEELKIEPRNVETSEELKIEPRNAETSEKAESNSSNEETSEGETVSEEKTTTSTEQASNPNTMSMPFIGVSAIQCVVAFLLIVIVLQQSKNASGITSSGNINTGDSYWNKNKSRSQESKLARITVILAIIFFILTVALGFIK